ncbi:MAG: phosphoglucomutase [Euryarchaeota archaeon]|nr:phosphoglucomutase [Euryarchaeota archaeon]
MKFSGSSGTRMIWGQELVDFAHALGLALGNSFDSVVLAGDFRETTDSLLSILAGAITGGGGIVYYGGHAPTPTLAYAARNHDVGVMVTASHNPPEYNGIKLWNPDGSAFAPERALSLENGRVVEWSDAGKIKAEDIIAEHRDALLREFGTLDLKVVVDCANGAGSVLTPHLLRSLGAEVITLNCHPSGLFPGHPSEPAEKNLTALKRLVLDEHAELGIAHDGDADRFIAVTREGKYLSGDEILAVFTRVLGFDRIVAPVDSSMLLDNFAEVHRCRVGDANVSVMMKKLGIEFGGENSGTQIFSAWRYTPDAIYSALKFAEIAMREDIDSIVAGFPKYVTLRENVYYTDRQEMERKIEQFVSEYEYSAIDGYRVALEDGWFLIRFSGTEPKVRITVEFEDEQRAKNMLDKIVSALR